MESKARETNESSPDPKDEPFGVWVTPDHHVLMTVDRRPHGTGDPKKDRRGGRTKSQR
jgi:hypothetical protein